nr:GDP-mannose 4,6-dehydratase [uncultured Acetatifactor sp.]
MRALITGSQGFVGRYLRQELEESGYEVVGLDIQPGEGAVQADLLNPEQLAAAVRQAEPDAVFHLAGQADVARSWKIPQKTMEINVLAAVNLMEAVRAFNPSVRMVLVGSSDQYGNLGEAGRMVSESLATHPQTPYAVSKKAQEEMARVYVRAYGMNICMTRSFNHGGAGQRLGFLIPDFASGIVKVERGEAKSLKVGNLTSRRDFTHVKDVARAYRLIGEKGKPGEVYNVGSGVTWSAQEILDKLCAMAVCPIPVEQDPARMRPSDTPVICCDHTKLTTDTGWQPQIPLEDILSDTLREWRERE